MNMRMFLLASVLAVTLSVAGCETVNPGAYVLVDPNGKTCDAPERPGVKAVCLSSAPSILAQVVPENGVIPDVPEGTQVLALFEPRKWNGFSMKRVPERVKEGDKAVPPECNFYCITVGIDRGDTEFNAFSLTMPFDPEKGQIIGDFPRGINPDNFRGAVIYNKYGQLVGIF